MLSLQQKQVPEALKQLKEVVHLDPADVESWFALFQAELLAQDFAAAREAAKRIAGLTPASSELFRSVAALQASAGDYQGAIPNLQKALAADPTSNDTRYNLALASLRNHQAFKAIPLLLSLRDMRRSGEVENLLGDAYEQENRPVEAVRAYQAAAELEPGNEDYTYDYVNELLTHKSFDAALLVAQAAAANFPASLRMQLALVAAQYGLGKTQFASAGLIDACARFPDSSLALYLRSVIAEAEGKPDATLMEQTRAYLERHPDDSTAWLVLGKTQARPEPQQALQSFSRCLALKETTAEAHFELARIYADAHDWSKAAEHAQRAVELNPRLSEAWYRLALASYHTGQKSTGDAAMQRFKEQHAADQNRSKVATFLYTLR
jgi:tetratricopeptide (TPR) repeat protein